MSTGHFSSPHDIAKPKLLSSALAFCFKFSLQGYVSCYLARICIAHLSIAGSSLEMTSSHDCFGPQRLSLALRQRTSKYILAGLYIGTLPFGCLELPEAVYLDLQPKLQGRAIDLGAGVGLTCMVLMRMPRGSLARCAKNIKRYISSDTTLVSARR